MGTPWRLLAVLLLFALLFAACTTPTAGASAAAATPSPSVETATASPSVAASPRPVGFVLPSGCRYVTAMQNGETAEWRVDCGAQANRDARGTLGPALTQQGWISCGVGLGQALAAKGAYMISVSEVSGAPGDEFISMKQRPRTSQECP